MAENQTSRDLPAITRETMAAAIETLAARRALKTSQVIPQAVYLDQLPNYNDFFAKFLVPNQLCILSESATRQWRSRREWVCEDGSPNFDFLQQAFGKRTGNFVQRQSHKPRVRSLGIDVEVLLYVLEKP